MRVLGAAAVVAGVPVAALVLLAAMGWAPLGPVLLAIGTTLLVALVLALRWSRDLDLLAANLRRIASDEPLTRNLPVLPGMQRLGIELERLARRAAARSALIEQLRRTDGTVVERLPDPLIVLAEDRAVRRANSAARAAFGADVPAVLRHPDLRAAIDRAFASGLTQTAEVTLPVPVPREVHAAVVPMDPPIADGGRAVVVLSDRSRERAVERMRADFVANVSHELRTPLASLIGFIDTLRGPAADDPPAQQRFLGIMGEQAARMNRLIDDLLSLSRIELIEHQAPSDTVDLDQLVTRLAAGFEPRLRERSVTLDLRLADDLPAVIGDADQLTQVLQNLLDNAVKYGRRNGTVRLEVAVAAPAVRRCADGRRPGRRHPARTSAAADRTVLSRRYRPLACRRRHRARSRHRQAHREPPSRAVVDRERGRHRHHGERVAAAGGRQAGDDRCRRSTALIAVAGCQGDGANRLG